MEAEQLNCPVCCNKTFDSKQLLLEHLSNIQRNLYCPICNSQWSSLDHLTEHLTVDNCQQGDTGDRVTDHPQIVFESALHEVDDKNSIQLTQNQIENESQNIDNQISSVDPLDDPVQSGDVSKMYVELLSKQLMKPCLQTQELKLIKEDGVSRYLIITEPEPGLNIENTIVTKQNNDGTISLTTVKDMKVEDNSLTDSLIASTENEPEEGQEEIYSCNTCGVSFSSVLDHIQNYHNDQDVVVEGHMDECESDATPVEFVTFENDDITTSGDKQTSRRVITDTGDIVEAPLSVRPDSVLQDDTNAPNDSIRETTEQAERLHTTRFVQVENLCSSVVKDIKESDKKGGPYHKVIMKEVKTQNGTNVKMYHCMTCNIYVNNLNEFKAHPCKILKYSCPHCPVVYENSKSLCAHMKVHKTKTENNSETPVSYECDLCCTIFPTNKSLKLHKRMHDPLKARPIELPVENKDGSEVTNTRYLCQICNKMIPLDYRIVHQNSHKTPNMYNCGICNKKFSSNEYLEMHMNVHNLDKITVSKQDKSLPYNCLYCNRRFARPHEKVKHERIHTGEKPHSCEICGKSFRVSYCLTLHMRTHTGARPYACQHCGKRFKAHSVYNHHLLTHSDVRAYKCPYCPKAFKTSVQLAGHKNSHTKPFSCQHCNRPFASLYAVRVHTETHARQNNLKFSCSVCGASYARAFALKDHIKQVHKQEVDSTDNLAGQEGDWVLKKEEKQSFNKELSNEVTELAINGDELIVP